MTLFYYFYIRVLRTYKRYVKNKARPEGSIAEAYVTNEALTYCSMYLRNIETKFNKPDRNYDGDTEKCNFLSVFNKAVRPFGAPKNITLSNQEYNKIRWYILNNCKELQPYIE